VGTTLFTAVVTAQYLNSQVDQTCNHFKYYHTPGIDYTSPIIPWEGGSDTQRLDMTKPAWTEETQQVVSLKNFKRVVGCVSELRCIPYSLLKQWYCRIIQFYTLLCLIIISILKFNIYRKFLSNFKKIKKIQNLQRPVSRYLGPGSWWSI